MIDPCAKYFLSVMKIVYLPFDISKFICKPEQWWKYFGVLKIFLLEVRFCNNNVISSAKILILISLFHTLISLCSGH